MLWYMTALLTVLNKYMMYLDTDTFLLDSDQD